MIEIEEVDSEDGVHFLQKGQKKKHLQDQPLFGDSTSKKSKSTVTKQRGLTRMNHSATNFQLFSQLS